MTVSLRSAGILGIAMAAVLAGGCASTPRLVTPTRSASAGTPASAVQLTSAMKLARDAWRLGVPVKLTIRNGVLLYCWTDKTVGSNIPTTQCLDEAAMRTMVDAHREEREQMQTMATQFPVYCGKGAGPQC